MRSPTLLACAGLTALIFAGASPAWCAQEKPVVPKAEPKRLTVSIQNQPWKKVLDWLADETRLPIVSPQIPTGTFTCVSPSGVSYTLPEVIDLVNESLMAAKFRLQRGPASFLLLAADERIDPALVPTVRPEDLPTRGRTELVRVVVSLKMLKAREVAPELKRLLGPLGEIGTLANRLVLQDTTQNVRQILRILQELDDQAPGSAAAPVIRAYPVRNNVEALAKLLQEVFRNAPSVRITPTSMGMIVVSGSAPDHEQVKHVLASVGTSPTPKVTELIPLGALQAVQTVATLQAMFGERGGPYQEADASRNALIIRGSPEQLQEIKAVLRTLGEAPAAATTRIITLERGSAAALAEALQNMIREMRPNPVRVIAPGQKSDPIPKNPARESETTPSGGVERTPCGSRAGDDSSLENWAESQFRRFDRNGDGLLSNDELPEDLRAERDKWDRNKDGLIDLSEYKEFVKAHAKGSQAKEPNKPPPLTLTVEGNQLIAVCADGQILALVAELTRQLTQPTGEGEFEVIRLRSSNAVEVAKVLEEAINGRGAVKRAGRARIVADPATNSLLVKASPLDLLTIRRLLRGALDSDREEAGAETRTWVIGSLKHAVAAETAKVLTAVYRGAGDRTSLSVTADQRTNSLVLRCSPALYRDVLHLVEQLDTKTPEKAK